MSEDIQSRLWGAVDELERRNLKPTAIYLGGHEYALWRSSRLASGVVRVADGTPEMVAGIPLFRVSEDHHFAVAHTVI